MIVLLHVGFFYALQSGLLREAAQVVLPKTVMVNFITPELPKPQPPAPQPAQPKTVPVVKKNTPPPPLPPKINTTPSEHAITTPPVAPEPPAPIAAAPPPAPPAPPPSPAPAQPRTVSSGIEYITPPQPVYPPASRRLGEEGKVMLRVLVNEKGRPDRVEIQNSSGSARLDDAARQAALRAVFKPHMEDGRPVAVFAIIPIRFQLDS